jgi:hypothetical protein
MHPAVYNWPHSCHIHHQPEGLNWGSSCLFTRSRLPLTRSRANLARTLYAFRLDRFLRQPDGLKFGFPRRLIPRCEFNLCWSCSSNSLNATVYSPPKLALRLRLHPDGLNSGAARFGHITPALLSEGFVFLASSICLEFHLASVNKSVGFVFVFEFAKLCSSIKLLSSSCDNGAAKRPDVRVHREPTKRNTVFILHTIL